MGVYSGVLHCILIIAPTGESNMGDDKTARKKKYRTDQERRVAQSKQHMSWSRKRTAKLRDLEARLAKAEEKADKWRLALENLTPVGSEFQNDVERCVAYVRERYDEQHEAMKDRVRLTRKLREAEEKNKRLTEERDNLKTVVTELTAELLAAGLILGE